MGDHEEPPGGPEAAAAPRDDAVPGAGPALQDEALSYEQARDELAQVVRRMEAGGTALEESLALWERGERMAAICEEWLAGARERLERAVRERADGEDGSDPRPER